MSKNAAALEAIRNKNYRRVHADDYVRHEKFKANAETRSKEMAKELGLDHCRERIGQYSTNRNSAGVFIVAGMDGTPKGFIG